MRESVKMLVCRSGVREEAPETSVGGNHIDLSRGRKGCVRKTDFK